MQCADCRHYYSIAITYRKNELEEKMLMNLQKKTWTHGLTLRYICLLMNEAKPPFSWYCHEQASLQGLT